MQGRLEGRKSEDGASYEVKQGSALLRSIPIDQAMTDRKLALAIKRNGWQTL